MNLFIQIKPEGFKASHIENTVTVGEMIEELKYYGKDTKIFIVNSKDETYSGITLNKFCTAES